MAARAKPSKRELIDTGKDKRYVKRDEEGQFDKVVDSRKVARPRCSSGVFFFTSSQVGPLTPAREQVLIWLGR